jgi:hypothetical protein
MGKISLGSLKAKVLYLEHGKIKNKLTYIDKDELEIKIEMCGH